MNKINACIKLIGVSVLEAAKKGITKIYIYININFKFRTVRKDFEDIPHEDVGLAARERGVLKSRAALTKQV